MAVEKVLVTGASGFVAAHIIKQLIGQGYAVVGTVRSDSKGEFFSKQYPLFQYEIVKDISKLDAFDQAFKSHPDIKYVLHTASPFNYKGTDPFKDLIEPAINGTLSALQAAKSYGPNVKKVVITSSIAAILHSPPNLSDHSIIYNEKSWNNITMEEGKSDMALGYVASKAIAEKAAWNFLEKEKPNFPITTVQMPLVFGPPINDIGIKNLNTSNKVIWELMNAPKDLPEFHDEIPYYLDVRDAAKTHINAMTNEGLDNKRCFTVAGTANGQLIVDTLRDVRPEYKEKLPAGKPGSFSLNDFAQVDNSETQKYLKLKYRSLGETVGDTADRLKELAAQQTA